MPNGVPPELFGPLGALVLAVLVMVGMVKVGSMLWIEHLKSDQDDRDQRDRAYRLLEQSLANNKAAIAAWDRRNSQDAARARRTDR
jgi:hypothetical protein